MRKAIKKGAIRELNPGPPVPKTGIIPLDQSPLVLFHPLIFLSTPMNYYRIAWSTHRSIYTINSSFAIFGFHPFLINLYQ